MKVLVSAGMLKGKQFYFLPNKAFSNFFIFPEGVGHADDKLL